MGEVYLVEHPRLPRREALKVLRPDVSSRLRFPGPVHPRADLSAKTAPPHIVAIHDRGEYDGQFWISMDYIDGTDLGHLAGAQHIRQVCRSDLVVTVVTRGG